MVIAAEPEEADDFPEVQRPERRQSDKRPPSLYIKKADLIKYGYTKGCKGCNAARGNLRAVGHSEACRIRIEQAIAQDAEDRDRIDEWLERVLKRTHPPSSLAGTSGTGPQTSVEVQPQPHFQPESSGSSGMQEHPAEGVPVLDGHGNMVDYQDDNLDQRLPIIPEVSPSEERSSTHDERPDNDERDEDNDVIMNVECPEDPAKDMIEIGCIMHDLGCSADPRTICSVHKVAEIFNKNRFQRDAPKYGLPPSYSLDLATGWDFNNPDDRALAWKLRANHKPKLLMRLSQMYSILNTS